MFTRILLWLHSPLPEEYQNCSVLRILDILYTLQLHYWKPTINTILKRLYLKSNVNFVKSVSPAPFFDCFSHKIYYITTKIVFEKVRDRVRRSPVSDPASTVGASEVPRRVDGSTLGKNYY